MKKLMFIFGTRPEAIKMAPLIHEFKKYPNLFETLVVVTAQHRQMLDQVLSLFDITSDYDLNIMKNVQNLYQITVNALTKLGVIIQKEKPDLVFVHGDTTTTFAAALASFYEKIPVAHVEAGLRSYDKFNPYPEEVNRLLSDMICQLHFVPTKGTKENLIKENISPKNIFITGNTVIDALHIVLKRKYEVSEPHLKKILMNKTNKIILVTAHRRENWGSALKNICLALKKIVKNHESVEIVYPVHLNPVVRDTVNKILKGLPRVHLIQPLDYVDFVKLIKVSYLVLTDSGGLQEEAPSLGKPVLVLRNVTERPEAVNAGTVQIVGVNKDKIFDLVSRLLTDKKEYNKMAKAVNPYGDGRASKRIKEAVLYYFGKNKYRPEEFVDGS